MNKLINAHQASTVDWVSNGSSDEDVPSVSVGTFRSILQAPIAEPSLDRILALGDCLKRKATDFPEDISKVSRLPGPRCV